MKLAKEAVDLAKGREANQNGNLQTCNMGIICRFVSLVLLFIGHESSQLATLALELRLPLKRKQREMK